MAIWKCECGSTQIRAYEWETVRFRYDLDVPENEGGWDGETLDSPGDEANILMAACCAKCTYELTDDELALVAKSISGLVLSGHPRLPINPNSIDGYVILNPAHFSGTTAILRDDSLVWTDYEAQLRQMYYFAKENDNRHLHVAMVLRVISFTEIADKYTLCEECSEVYNPKDHDGCPGCAYELAL